MAQQAPLSHGAGQRSRRRLSRTQGVVLAMLVLLTSAISDVLIGPYHFLDVLYLISALLAAWFVGRGWGAAWVIVGGACWAVVRWQRPELSVFWWIWNVVARVGVWSLAVVLLLRVKEHLAAQARLIGELREALDQIHELKGLLPVCAWCRKIRDDDGYWLQLEQYVGQHTNARITHGICPDCARKMMEGQQPGKAP